MRMNPAIAAILAAAFALAGCSVFGSDDKEQATATPGTPAVVYAPVESVRNIEIGRTRNGFVITATGLAPGLGYSTPELRPRREGKLGPDGFIDYDFVARAPDPGLNLGQGTVPARMVRADLQVGLSELRGAQGIRIHAVQGGMQMNF